MSRVRLSLAVAAVLALVLTTTAGAASSPKLHPSGFGPHSYASWKGGEGLPDSTGNKDQALYFQKDTPTSTIAAGVAVFSGFEGLDVADVWPLSFYYRTDGHCGAGAPRFNLRVDTGAGVQTLFFGCNSGMLPTGESALDDAGRLWLEEATAGPAPTGTVVSIAIVFDEGNEVPTCESTIFDPNSCVFLDNIRVGSYLWTSASDNGGGNTVVDEATLEAMWGAPPITLLTGD